MQIKIEWTYTTAKGTEVFFQSEEMTVEKAVLVAEDLEKTGRARHIHFIDHQESSWKLKELKKYMEGIQTEPHNVTVYFDGGFDRDSRHSGLGCAIYYDQNGKSYRLRKNAAVDELKTNNEAEYAALHLALQELEFLGVHHLPVTFVGDSQVVINQLKDEWPCFEEELSRWMDRIEEKTDSLGIQPDYQLVGRKKNQEADHLASQALKNIEIMSTIEVDAE
ncbi:reverse transcriptase-like protein [Virgibacillus sp. MSP4-1]|uniref:ribonuclease H family protein n=1 Tax=Virgibacillus sp. MSP4-1 TaxID=2700081 RepID=UPI0003A122D4|nr:ribonuclease H family protein [Virgibacillus sp. MSP4-1]QHS21845.1 reverse transcriptase-like protein [Virgibacillus sp. MSP4-1]